MVARFLKAQLFCVIFCFQIISPKVVAQGDVSQLNAPVRNSTHGDSTLWVIKAGDVIPPVTLALAGLVAQGRISRHFHEKVHSQYPNFHSKADEFLPYAPGVVSLALASAGVKGRHKLGDQIILALLSNIIAQGVTQSLKRVIKYPRPDQSDYYSFPSGHTTTAFANATILHEEYGQRSVLYSIGGYGTATAVGTLRVLNDKHWLADVLMGAGIGIGATKVLYISYPWLQQTVRRMKH
ncbi:phosphatase PAP2 family protein [Dyadobacter psychrophilus]|uniref:PAP2 superfamily protein n=1 Tax=Dyadobacter psychrophilus TaxID=651661 RepID=A0A1T5H8I4_9BACT|nr:phosphatase PAP2 family protein [Dyadobacter psychrophilus]SKC16977.1 PAP2 superfamily protein [Dyadobacter psychrophilus]